ncbi:hypothetical protein VF04_34975 [Nostoc linckia z7]|uniref:Uncharacterized protein n=1 Tax=Nostoc linckia z7 TaxID=1628745 RepID=A0ABX4KFE1_NOSLI|nr:hypothetical protein [Nostoc linckia]PHJ51477.1 hypothetical protein VF02_37885 [Nostoc linckia z1]PHJ59266.1 hypothetical protein VF05_32250 [Nostoc linckia z3]PHJ63661.1 hypothetical protein VF03_30125 [Nostoc linckia z2]PHJ73877.1 hypothetical protein VF06_35765 [Nostoc linckia z4]PHJ87182.1 hypothetical protein VF04_34975 [Nostoc linckia z7]
MTKEQYKQRRDELEAQIKELEQQYIDACPYKVGDKVVVVTYFLKEKEVFIQHITISRMENRSFYAIDFAAVKRDGTMSQQGAGLSWLGYKDIIRKID